MTKHLEHTRAASPEPAKRKTPKLSIREDNEKLLVEMEGDFTRISKKADSKTVAFGLVSQIASLGSQSMRVDEAASNFALSFVDAMQPQDAAEALFLTQMAATHQATMMLARRLNHVDNLPQQDAAERALNKTARTFAAQMDTLKRYRSKGQQVVRVERVTVNEGGQAVVGNIERRSKNWTEHDD